MHGLPIARCENLFFRNFLSATMLIGALYCAGRAEQGAARTPLNLNRRAQILAALNKPGRTEGVRKIAERFDVESPGFEPLRIILT